MQSCSREIRLISTSLFFSLFFFLFWVGIDSIGLEKSSTDTILRTDRDTDTDTHIHSCWGAAWGVMKGRIQAPAHVNLLHSCLLLLLLLLLDASAYHPGDLRENLNSHLYPAIMSSRKTQEKKRGKIDGLCHDTQESGVDLCSQPQWSDDVLISRCY